MRRTAFCILLLCLLAVLTACGNSEGDEKISQYLVYYLDADGTGLVSEIYETDTEEQDTVKLIDELLRQLQTDGSEGIYQYPIEPEVEVSDFQIKETQFSVYFTAAYNNKRGLKEILSRAAVVKTLCQVSGVDFVEFYVEDQPLMLTGNAVGLMNSDTFIDELNPANAEQSKQVTLYFADASGQMLEEVSTKVTYSAAEPLAKLLMEKLIAGPDSMDDLNVSDLLPTIPPDTVLNSVTIRDNICYVDVSKDFLELSVNVRSDVVVYSIVNTLCELPNVSRVQLTVEGEQSEKYGETKNFNTPYERNLNLIAGGAESQG